MRLAMILLLTCSPTAFAEEHRVGQQDKKFTTDQLVIKKGDSVNFDNNDPFFHNVFSLSSSAIFDLGSYPKGDSRQVTFDEAGEIEVECAIHPSMKMKIRVEE